MNRQMKMQSKTSSMCDYDSLLGVNLNGLVTKQIHQCIIHCSKRAKSAATPPRAGSTYPRPPVRRKQGLLDTPTSQQLSMLWRDLDVSTMQLTWPIAASSEATSQRP